MNLVLTMENNRQNSLLIRVAMAIAPPEPNIPDTSHPSMGWQGCNGLNCVGCIPMG
jgi:hypothetical protein